MNSTNFELGNLESEDASQWISVTQRTHLSETALAARWAMSPKTLQRWRMEGRGPIYLKLGRRVSYPLKQILAYEERYTHISTSKRANF